ncbi:MAG: hypothetical protein WB996_04810 [Ignavibacteriaceae bacterium]
MKFAIYILLIFSFFNQVQQKQFSPLTRLFEKNGLEIYFIYYSEGNGVKNNGVVVYLANRNDYAVSYQFNLIFRAGKTDKSTLVSGSMKPLESRTGSNDGLYFIPYKDKRSITEVGISGCKVEPI